MFVFARLVCMGFRKKECINNFPYSLDNAIFNGNDTQLITVSKGIVSSLDIKNEQKLTSKILNCDILLLSPDKKFILLACCQKIYIFSLIDSTSQVFFRSNKINSLTISPDSKYVFVWESARDYQAYLLDLETAVYYTDINKNFKPVAIGGGIKSVGFSPCQYLVFILTDSNILLYSYEKEQFIQQFSCQGVKQAYFSSDGKHLFGLSSAYFYVWNIEIGKLICKQDISKLGISCMAYSPISNLLALAGSNDIYICTVGFLKDKPLGELILTVRESCS